MAWLRDPEELEPATLEFLAGHGIKGIRNGSLNLAQLTELATKIGATVESNDFGQEYRECEVLAPQAHNFGDAGENFHVLLTVVQDWHEAPFRPSYNDLANRMRDGIEHCGPGCDCCWDNPQAVVEFQVHVSRVIDEARASVAAARAVRDQTP